MSDPFAALKARLSAAAPVNPPESTIALDATVAEELAPPAAPAQPTQPAPEARAQPAAPPAPPAPKTRRTAKVVQDELDDANQKIAALELRLDEGSSGGEELDVAQAKVVELTALLEAAQAALATTPTDSVDPAVALNAAGTDELLTATFRRIMMAQKKALGSL